MISNELIQYLSNSIVMPDRIKGVPNYDNISTMSDDLVFVQVRKYADDFFLKVNIHEWLLLQVYRA